MSTCAYLNIDYNTVKQLIVYSDLSNLFDGLFWTMICRHFLICQDIVIAMEITGHIILNNKVPRQIKNNKTLAST